MIFGGRGAGAAIGRGLKRGMQMTGSEAKAFSAARAAGGASWWNNLPRDMRNSSAVARRTMGGNEALGSVARWAMMGAGIGAIRGAADNMIGQDRVSVIGGALQGAMIGGGLRAARVGSRRLMAKGAAPLGAESMAYVKSGVRPPMYGTSGMGRMNIYPMRNPAITPKGGVRSTRRGRQTFSYKYPLPTR